MSRGRYSLPAMALHWLQAVLVLGLLWLGWTMVDMPKGAERTATYALHKSLGLLSLAVVLVRLLWRKGHPGPAPLFGGWEQRLATGVHHGLYAFLMLAPLAAYLASSYSSYPLKFFGYAVPKIGSPDEGVNAIFKEAHVWLAWFGALLIALHVIGALKHALLKDGVLQRMLPAWLLRD